MNAAAALKLNLAAVPTVWERIAALRCRDLDRLAPRMKDRVVAALEDCVGQTVIMSLPSGRAVEIALDAMVYETERSDELQQIYYAQGTTNAKTARHGWHFFGLAVDVISREYEWFTGRSAVRMFSDRKDRDFAAEAWFSAVAASFKGQGCDWGGDWRSPDMPHFQFGGLRASPSDRARALFDEGGREAVWLEVGAV